MTPGERRAEKLRRRRQRRAREALRRLDEALYLAPPAGENPHDQLVSLWRRQAVDHGRCPVCAAVPEALDEIKAGAVARIVFEHAASCPVGEGA